MNAFRGLILIVALAVMLLGAVVTMADVRDVCPGLVDVDRLYVMQRSRFVEIEDAEAVASFEEWDASLDNWIGYDQGGYRIMPTRSLSTIYLYPEDYDEQANPWGFSLVIVYTNPAHPDVVLPMIFEDIEPGRDGHIHPCATWVASREWWDAWLAEVTA